LHLVEEVLAAEAKESGNPPSALAGAAVSHGAIRLDASDDDSA
jgi:hypothetical protein